LACAALECGKDFGFKFLVETVGAGALPLPISLAIRCELESATNLDTCDLLKYHKEKLRKLLAASGKAPTAQRVAVQVQIDELFEKPISARKRLARAS